MKKLIFKKFILDTLTFFIISIIIMGTIVWTLQAINYFDFVTNDGHGLKVYFSYAALNFPKILHRILPFIFFISLFYIITSYENRNELNIYWLNGISRVSFANKIILMSILLMLIQIWFGSYLSPLSQLKARSYLKNSNVDFFTSLLREKKFVNTVQGLTIFIDKKNQNGTFSDIFIDDSTQLNPRMIYAKSGVLVDNDGDKIFQLYNGKVINNNKSKINIFEFEQINFYLKGYASKTIVAPKIQEVNSKTLINCLIDENLIYKNFSCTKNIKNQLKQELLKRFYKPIYIPLIAIICCYLFFLSQKKISFFDSKKIIFLIIFIILVISETSLRYSTNSDSSLIIYFLTPLFLMLSAYLIFLNKNKYV
jgi:lipopolysaccharide export system permease protein